MAIVKTKKTLKQYIPLIDTIQNYNKGKLSADFIAALSTSLITLPQVMVCATIIGIKPVYGLYTAMIAILLGSIFGSNNLLITGPTNAIGLLIAGSLTKFADMDILQTIFLLTFLAGGIQVLFAVLKFGKIVNYISSSVMTGFMTGAGLLIGLGQLNVIFGISIPNSNTMGNIEKLYNFVIKIPQTNLYALGVGILTLTIIIVSRKLHKSIPGPFIAVVVVGVLAFLFDLGGKGVKLTDGITSAIPPFQMLNFAPIANTSIWTAALALAIVGLVEAISISKGVAGKTGEKIDVDQEFLGQGIANMGASFFQGITSSGSFSKTAMNFQSGAKTRIAGIFTSVILFILLAALAPASYYIASPALAGILIYISYHLIDRKEIARVIKMGGVDLFVMTATFLGTIFLDLDTAVYIGVGLSILLYLKLADKAVIKIYVPSVRFPGEFKVREIDWITTHTTDVLVLQIEGNLYFGMAQHLQDCLDSLKGHAKAYILRFKNVSDLDATTLNVFAEFTDWANENNFKVYYSGLTPHLLGHLEKAEIDKKVGMDNLFMTDEYIFRSSNEALEKAREDLGVLIVDSSEQHEIDAEAKRKVAIKAVEDIDLSSEATKGVIDG